MREPLTINDLEELKLAHRGNERIETLIAEIEDRRAEEEDSRRLFDVIEDEAGSIDFNAKDIMATARMIGPYSELDELSRGQKIELAGLSRGIEQDTKNLLASTRVLFETVRKANGLEDIG